MVGAVTFEALMIEEIITFILMHVLAKCFLRISCLFTFSDVVQNVDSSAKKFSVPQVEYPLGGSSKKGSHVYFLLIVAMILPL